MKKFEIFVSSADSYSDLWPVFFDLFKLNWPEYDGVIYLNTEEKTFQHEGLNIVCTQVGKKSFGKVFRAGLDKVESDHVLFMMIDYILMGKVNVAKLNEYYEYFTASDINALYLVYQGIEFTRATKHKDICIILPYSHSMFSHQMAFWKKDILYKMVLPHENPWTSEYYGDKRANKSGMSIANFSQYVEHPIPYDFAGCLHQGQWLDNAIEYLQSINYEFDFDKRGYYKELPRTIKNRIKVRWKLTMDGLMGSYWSSVKI